MAAADTCNMRTTKHTEPIRLTAEKVDTRVAYSPSEFARPFGRHRSWTYRMLYAGLIQKLDLPGRIRIPHSELERLLGQLTTHGGAR